ncbi:AAA family ATPase [Streptomyces sp. ISL-11]|uniref:AAA family ATPase n=1 Tax=Streptomyces sp. ISL-11 TaxID=2819174 RepID=UPI001BEA13B9|nr:LuxR family transcriptional regulator [Streptomyces sp. ISL-11]MBT2382951.1 AAA family ATPase [Streptomyces sp. ISL-11]
MTMTSPRVGTGGHTDRLWERDTVLSRMTALACRVEGGAGGLLVIRGGTGTGRTTLLESFARDEAHRGTAVLGARCSADESDAGHGAVLQLFESELQSVPGRPPAVGREHRGRSLHGDDLPSRLWRLLRSKASAGPVLLAVDDIHLADAPSRRWLAQVARRLDRLPVLLAVTERWQYDLVPPAPAFAHVVGQSPAHLCTLKPLGPAASASLVRTALGEETPNSLTADCHRVSGGNPMLLHALLSDLREITADGTHASRLPESCAELHPGMFAGAVARWLNSCGPRTADTARAFAELQDEDDALALLPQVTGCDPVRVPGWAAEVARQGLLRHCPAAGRAAFAHPLLREAVTDSWHAHQRTEVRRHTAELLHHRGDPVEAVARHLLPVPAVGAPWAADVLVDAAGRAVRDGRTDDAVAALRRALAEPLSARRRGDVLTELGCLEVPAERAAGVRHLAEALRLQQRDGGKVRAATTLGTALVARGEVQTALEVLSDLSEAFADSTDLAHAAQAATALISSHDGGTWLQVVAQLRRAEERSPGGLAPTALALLTEYDATAGRLSAREVMERVRTLTAVPLDPLLEPYLLASAATLAQWADQLGEADRLVARGLAAYRPPLLHPAHQSLLSVQAEGEVMRGRYDVLLAARPLWPAAPERRTDPYPGNIHLRSQALIALTETGRLSDAERLADTVAARGPHGSWEWSEFLYARGLLRSAAGDPAGALPDLLECGRRQSARESVSPIVTPWRSAAADCHVALGSAEHAVPLAEEELRLARIWGTPRTMGRALRALAVSLGGRHGLELAEQAVETLRGAAEPLPELVPALISLGQALHDSGQRQQARDVLREAAQQAEWLGAARARLTAEQALRRCGARRLRAQHTGASALTSSERRIAQLAATGHSNKEAAELLHLAVRTVETHLTHCYRKLGIRRRADLPAALGDTP